MRAIDATRRSGVAIADTRSVLAAAQIMKQADVGALAVVDDQQRLVGLVTDRDIVSRAVAAGLSLDAPISEVMTVPVATIPADADLHDPDRRRLS